MSFVTEEYCVSDVRLVALQRSIDISVECTSSSSKPSKKYPSATRAFISITLQYFGLIFAFHGEVNLWHDYVRVRVSKLMILY
jgi:hypothetical protein